MTTTYRRPPKLAGIALSVAGALGFSPAAESGLLTIATEPLGTATSSIKPNVIFILGKLGSMHREYMPDYVMAPSAFVTGSAACFDGDTGRWRGLGRDLQRPRPPRPSDQRPAVHEPGLQHHLLQPRDLLPSGGELRRHRDAGAGRAEYFKLDERGAPTPLRHGELAPAPRHQLRHQSRRGREDGRKRRDRGRLASGYPDRVSWRVEDYANAASSSNHQNSAYTLPELRVSLRHDQRHRAQPWTTAPYYYRMQTAQYCRPDGSDCRSSSAIDPALHTLQQPEFCLDSELTNCAVGSAVTTNHVFSGVRWCNNANLQEDPVTNNPRVNYCQRKQIAPVPLFQRLPDEHDHEDRRTFPAAMTMESGLSPSPASTPAAAPSARITIGGVSVISGPIVVPSSSSVGVAASAIANAITLHASSPEFSAAAFGANVIITGGRGFRRVRRVDRGQCDERVFGIGEGHDHHCQRHRQHGAHHQLDHHRRHTAAVQRRRADRLRQQRHRGRRVAQHRGGERMEHSPGAQLGDGGHRRAHQHLRTGRRLLVDENRCRQGRGRRAAFLRRQRQRPWVRHRRHQPERLQHHCARRRGERADDRHQRDHHVGRYRYLQRHAHRARRRWQVRAHRHRPGRRLLPEDRHARRLPWRDLHLRGRDDQFRELVHLLPLAPQDDEPHAARLDLGGRYLSRRLHHHQSRQPGRRGRIFCGSTISPPVRAGTSRPGTASSMARAPPTSRRCARRCRASGWMFPPASSIPDSPAASRRPTTR